MSNITTEQLQYAIENGMLDAELLQLQIEMKKRKEILENHPYKIWEGKDGNWYTHLPDEKKEENRALKKRKTEKGIQDCIVEYYLELERHPCFRQVYEQWIAEKAEYEEIGKNSITRYNNDFERFFPLNEPFCKIRLCDMTNSELERFIKKTIKEKELTAKTYAMLRLIITGVFKFAKREGYTEFSISTFFKDLSLPSNIFKKKIKPKELEIFNEQEAKLLLQYLLDNPTIVNLGIALSFFCGVRVGELSALKREDNSERNLLKIRRTEIMYRDNDLNERITTVKEYPKTDSGVRNVIIPDFAQRILDEIILINPDGEYLFMKDGSRIKERRFNYYLKVACEKVGVSPRSTHKVRKTYGSMLLSNNVDTAVVLNQMGHSDIATTQSYYHYDITTDKSKFDMINHAIAY